MKKILLITSFIFLFSISVFSQTQSCPQGLICISQEAANKAAENARVLPLLQQENSTLKTSLEEERENTKQAQETARKNEADLRDRLQQTSIELATKTGQLIGSEAEKVRLTAIIDFMLKNGRKKCQPFSLCIN